MKQLNSNKNGYIICDFKYLVVMMNRVGEKCVWLIKHEKYLSIDGIRFLDCVAHIWGENGDRVQAWIPGLLFKEVNLSKSRNSFQARVPSSNPFDLIYFQFASIYVRHIYSCDYIEPVACSTNNANPTLDRYSGWQGMNTKLKCGTTSKSGIQARRPGMPKLLLALLRVRDILLMRKALRILF